MSLSAYDSGARFDSWLECRVAAFEEALRQDPQAAPEAFLADCPDESARAALAGELDRIMGESRGASWRLTDRHEADQGTSPERIGPFRLGRQLGRGGFGRVFEAWDERLERPVALKLMREPLDKPGGRGSTFLAEARAVSRLRHPSIVVLFDVGEFEGLPYLVYERIDGTDLKAVLADGPLPVDQAMRIAGKIGLALVHAHDRGILHRDVKPSNVMIDTSGEPFLTDFGLSGSMSPGPENLAGSLCGTLPYMAPEQAEGEQATEASDVYGLGAVLYECLTGQPPFSGTARMVRQGVLGRMPEPPSSLIPGLDDRVDRLVLKALAKAPGDRYASVREFVDEIGLRTGDEGDRTLEGAASAHRGRQRPGKAIARYARTGALALGAFCMAFVVWPGSWRRSASTADVRAVLTDSASLARERMMRERDRRFREAALVDTKQPATDFAAFYRTLLTVGEGLPKPVRARFQLDCATACRNEGDLGEAANRLFEAAALADSALQDADDASSVRLDIARALAGWSDLPGANSLRRLAEARRAVDLSQQLADAGGSLPELAYDLITLGNLLRSSNAADEAENRFVRALAILQDLPADTSMPQRTIEHLRQQYLMAQALRGSGRKAEALAAYRLAGRTLGGLPESIRTSEYWLDIEADRSFHEARLMREAGDPRGALPLIERAVRIWSDLAERLKETGADQFDLPLAHSRNAKGAILADLEDTESAIVTFDEAIGHYHDVLQRDPAAINARRGLANVLHTSARLSAEMGRRDDASVRFEQAIRQRKIIVGDARGSVSDRIDLAASCQAAGQAKVSIGHVDSGLDSLRLAVAMFRELEALRPEDRSLRQRSSEAARSLDSHSTTSDTER